jgi:hypothetical protein
MNLNNITIHNWMLSLNRVSPFFINKELYERMTERRFINNYSDTVYLMGEYKPENSNNQKFFALTSSLKLITNGIAITSDGLKIFLKEKSNEYVFFEEAVSNNIPIVYNWIIGVNELKVAENRKQNKNNTIDEKELYISCNMVADGVISYVKDKIIDQNIEESTITLKKNGKVFVSWGSKNTYQSIGLKKYEETVSYQYSEVNEKVKLKQNQLKTNLNIIETLLTKKNDLSKYTPYQVEELLNEISTKKDQLEISNKRIIKAIQKNEEKANKIYFETKRLRNLNMNLIKGKSIDLINDQDILTKNINIRIKFFENPKDIESDLENKDICKLFKKKYIYLKRGIKN